MFNVGMGNLWNDSVAWENLSQRLSDLGVKQVHIKYLSRNHNSKNQIAGLGSDLSALGHLHPSEVTMHQPTSRKPKAGPPIYRTFLPWVWLSETGLSPAPETKLIYYPQYPELRLSGFLDSSPNAPRELLAFSSAPESRGQEDGRVLIFGSSSDQKVYAAVVSAYSPAAAYLAPFNSGLGKLVSLKLGSEETSKDILFRELRAIHEKDQITAYRLHPDGSRSSCNAPNCHGVTLESELGIVANGLAQPDFLDWEIKAHRVKHLNSHLSSRITLLTPNPDSGEVKERGTTWLTQTYGNLSATGERWDLSGILKAGDLHEKTGLMFGMEGFDAETRKITSDGFLYLRDPATDTALGQWSFAKLLTHWQTKHAKAVFVPCVMHSEKPRVYQYGTKVHVGEGTSFIHFLNAVATKSVVLDPGLNTKLQADGSWKAHTRYQFRSSLSQASSLYRSFEKVDLTD